MGTLLQIAARGPDQLAVEAAMEAALNAVDRVDRLMSFHRADSELTRGIKHLARILATEAVKNSNLCCNNEFVGMRDPRAIDHSFC